MKTGPDHELDRAAERWARARGEELPALDRTPDGEIWPWYPFDPTSAAVTSAPAPGSDETPAIPWAVQIAPIRPRVAKMGPAQPFYDTRKLSHEERDDEGVWVVGTPVHRITYVHEIDERQAMGYCQAHGCWVRLRRNGLRWSCGDRARYLQRQRRAAERGAR